jgi:hypothetical protein
MTFPFWAWVTFAALVAVLLFLDLFVFHRGAKEVPFREAMWLSGFWIAISLVFGGFVWVVAGPSAGGEYLAAYLIEKSLSLDNVFVFAVIFSAFAVPRKYRYHVLFWGVIGALVARAVFILAGTSLLSAFDWLVFVFGAFLLFTALRMFRGRDEDADPQSSRVLKLMGRILPTTGDYRGDHFFMRENGKLYATPLLAALLVGEVADRIFHQRRPVVVDHCLLLETLGRGVAVDLEMVVGLGEDHHVNDSHDAPLVEGLCGSSDLADLVRVVLHTLGVQHHVVGTMLQQHAVGLTVLPGDSGEL